MEYSKNFNFALPSRDNYVDLADINEIANNFRKVDENAVRKEDVDQKYDPTSKNAQSGIAVNVAFSDKIIPIGVGKNLFNPYDADVVEGKIFNDNGELIITNANYMTSGYIAVEEGKTYYCSVTRAGVRQRIIRSYAFYDGNKKFVSGSGNSSSLGGVIAIQTEQNIKYIRISTYSASYGGSEWQFEADAQTDYEPYHFLYSLSENVIKSFLKTEIENNESLIKTSKTINIFNKDAVINSHRYDETTGKLKSGFNSSKSTELMYIKVFDKVVVQNTIAALPPTVSVFFDSNMNFMLGYVYTSTNTYPDTVWKSNMLDGASVTIIPIPENACYCAFSVPNDWAEDLMVYGVAGKNVKPLPTPYQDYVEAYRNKQEILPVERFIKSYFNGKKVIAIGDSITEGIEQMGTTGVQAWTEQVASMFNMDFVNYGIGGSEIAVNKTNSVYTPMSIRFASMDNDADLIIVAGGTNDWSHNTVASNTDYQIGTFGDTDNTTFYGALDVMCKGLLSKYAGKNIMFMTPIKRDTGGMKYYEENANGNTLEDFANAIKKVCGFYGIPVLDMFNECTLNPIINEIKTAYIPDGSHPNQKGHQIMARQVAGFVSKLANDIDYN